MWVDYIFDKKEQKASLELQLYAFVFFLIINTIQIILSFYGWIISYLSMGYTIIISTVLGVLISYLLWYIAFTLVFQSRKIGSKQRQYHILPEYNRFFSFYMMNILYAITISGLVIMDISEGTKTFVMFGILLPFISMFGVVMHPIIMNIPINKLIIKIFGILLSIISVVLKYTRHDILTSTIAVIGIIIGFMTSVANAMK